jgi:hypothetical protein
MRTDYLLVIIVALIAVSCTADTPKLPEGKICASESDCVTPGEYLLRSDCPFGSACIEGSCQVVCQMWAHSSNEQDNLSFPVPCETAADCSCDGYGGRDTLSCSCLKGVCTAVVGPIQ